MKKTKKDKLRARGWKVGNTAEFLSLSPQEETLIDIRLALAHQVKLWRTKKKLTQQQLADALESSQSRIAKMESGDPSVSIELLLRCLLYLGSSQKNLGRVIATAS